MRLIIEPNYEQLSKWAANYVAAKIKKANPTAEKPFVLGLPTGSSPLGMYKNLIELNKQIKLSTGVRVYPDQWNVKKQEAYISCRLTELDNENNTIVNEKISKLKLYF